MNNKGFTLVEALSAVILISLVLVITIRSFGKTISLTKEESYKIMKKNIIVASENYVKECLNNTITCDFSFENNNQIKAKVLKESGYFKNLESPIDGKDLSDCLIIKVKKEKGVITSTIEDNCY